MPERDDLYARCNQRFKHMIKEGALDEVRAFLHTPLPENLPVMKTLGLRELMSHLKGEISLEEAIRKAQQTTRNYAKRQMTWFRHQWSY